MAIVERGDDGGLYLPPELLSHFLPHAVFEIQADADSLVVRSIDRGAEFWQRATTAQRIDAIREWTEADRPPAPDLSLEMMSRETIYE